MAAKISAFADEIDADPKVQLSTLRGEQIKYIELRGAWGINVMNLSDAQCRELKNMFDGEGFKVSCIASPIGKVRLDENWDEHFELFKKAVDLAEFFGCQYIRIFSYYAPEGENILNTEEEEIQGVFERIEVGRENLTKMILERASELVPQYGIELLDVQVKRLNYIEDVRKKVYERMISERQRIASKYRSEGEGKKAEIIGMKEKELNRIYSEAYRKSESIRGEADAKATRIYAEAYRQDPEFYSFLKTLEVYKNTMGENDRLILTTDTDLFRYLRRIQRK